MDKQMEFELLYASAVALISSYIGRPPPHAILNPSGWAKAWAKANPDKAYNLASDLYELLHQHFSTGRY